MTTDRADAAPQPTGSPVDAARRPRVDSFGILLPGSWWTIDLRAAGARRRSVAQVVDHQLGRTDDRAALRADARRHLNRVAADAARAGGRLLAVSLMVAGGLPLPATLTVYRLPGQDLTTRGMAELRASLHDDGPGECRLDLADGPVGPMLRRVGRRAAPDDLGASELPMLVADYWLDPDDGQGLLYLVFSSPVIEAQDALVHLFDVIAGSVGPAEGEE